MPHLTPHPAFHCPRCDYNLAGAALSSACPECGLAEARRIAEPDPGFRHRPWLHRYAIVLVVATFVLLVAGGTVTSKGVGMAVPDWPNTYGYNMFLFPPSMWKGGVFWEHTHRLLGSLVGMLTIGVAVWLGVTQSKARRGRPWLRLLGFSALLLVIVQGVMGGLRVTEISTTLAIIHGITAQAFLCVTVLIAAATGKWWRRASVSIAATNEAIKDSPLTGLRRFALITLAVVFVQLILGAAMRHTGSGLAIPDFPASYGQVVPPMSQQGIQDAINALPFEHATQYYTAAQVSVHFAHRVWAMVTAITLIALLTIVARKLGETPGFRGPTVVIFALLVAQLALGATVIWSGRHPELATAHQATGAVLLATLALLTIRIHVQSDTGTAARIAEPSSSSIRDGVSSGVTAALQGAGA